MTEPEAWDAQKRLAMLGEVARSHLPRLFCLYGAYRSALLSGDDALFLGWGMEFPGLRKAVWWEPEGATSHSDSAASLFEHYQLIADARLVWLGDVAGVPKKRP